MLSLSDDPEAETLVEPFGWIGLEYGENDRHASKLCFKQNRLDDLSPDAIALVLRQELKLQQFPLRWLADDLYHANWAALEFQYLRRLKVRQHAIQLLRAGTSDTGGKFVRHQCTGSQL